MWLPDTCVHDDPIIIEDGVKDFESIDPFRRIADKTIFVPTTSDLDDPLDNISPSKPVTPMDLTKGVLLESL